ncbi:MAG: ABC transporter ATP-binding protein [Armatimonadota bacterium]|nr:ABC transporter ATP-binding protein [Armatimonadota bacterium]
MPATPLLELVDVGKSYDSVPAESLAILKNVSLQLATGESVAIIGPSGSGKSTLLNIMGTLDQPTSGQVLLEGRDLSQLSAAELARVRNWQIGFVFQLHHLLPQCTVLENVLVPTLVNSNTASRQDSEARARRLLERVGLASRLGHRPGQLSGGEQQRVAVVRALINAPKLLLADEPTGSLDRAAAENLTQLLVGLNREENVTLVVVTHSLELASHMSRQLALADGALLPEGDGA